MVHVSISPGKKKRAISPIVFEKKGKLYLGYAWLSSNQVGLPLFRTAWESGYCAIESVVSSPDSIFS